MGAISRLSDHEKRKKEKSFFGEEKK